MHNSFLYKFEHWKLHDKKEHWYNAHKESIKNFIQTKIVH